MNPLPRDPRSIHVASDATPAAGGPAVSPDLPDAEVSRRRRWPWVVALLAVFLLAPTLGLSVAAWSTWRGVERVDLSGVLSDSPSGTNYLIVGTDNRDGVATDIENAGVIFGEGVSGERTDTIALMRVEGDAVSLLAIPRDLYVPLDGGAPNRINAAFAFGGPAALIRTVQQELGIPVDHYLEVDFAGFLGLVDALGAEHVADLAVQLGQLRGLQHREQFFVGIVFGRGLTHGRIIQTPRKGAKPLDDPFTATSETR